MNTPYPQYRYTKPATVRDWVAREAAAATAALEAEIAEDAREAADSWIDALIEAEGR